MSFVIHVTFRPFFFCLSAQTNAISGSEANVMSNKFVSHIDQVHDIGDPMNMYCNSNPQSVEAILYTAVGQNPTRKRKY